MINEQRLTDTTRDTEIFVGHLSCAGVRLVLRTRGFHLSQRPQSPNSLFPSLTSADDSSPLPSYREQHSLCITGLQDYFTARTLKWNGEVEVKLLKFTEKLSIPCSKGKSVDHTNDMKNKTGDQSGQISVPKCSNMYESCSFWNLFMLLRS